MLTGEEVLEIRILHRQGRSIRAIARDLKVSRWTVRKYLCAPDRDPGYGPRAPRPSKLDPFKDDIRMRIREAVPRRLPATVYLREIRALGYEGGISIPKDWLAREYPQVAAPRIVRFETPTGRGLDGDPARRGQAVGLCRHAGLQPVQLHVVCRQRVLRDADRSA